MLNPKCTFCSIANGRCQAEIVFQDQHVTAFLDWNPINPGHVLVIPNIHEPDFEELSTQLLAEITRTVQALSKVIKCVYSPKKVGLAVAGFDIPHTHVHIIPMYEHHDLTSKSLLDGTLNRATDEELASNAAKIRRALVSSRDDVIRSLLTDSQLKRENGDIRSTPGRATEEVPRPPGKRYLRH